MKQDTIELQPTWSNSPTYAKLYADVDASSGIQDEIRTDLEAYKLIKAGGAAIKAKPGKSTKR